MIKHAPDLPDDPTERAVADISVPVSCHSFPLPPALPSTFEEKGTSETAHEVGGARNPETTLILGTNEPVVPLATR